MSYLRSVPFQDVRGGRPLAGGMVDQVLNFRDIEKWFAEEGITLDETTGGRAA